MSGKRAADDGRDVRVHGAVDDAAFDRPFKALAHSTRRQILDLLQDHPRTTGELCDRFPELDRCTTMQHIGVLERAGLIIAQRRGRERWNHLDVLPIKLIHDRWIGDYARSAVDLLARLQTDLDTTGRHDRGRSSRDITSPSETSGGEPDERHRRDRSDRLVARRSPRQGDQR